MLQTLKYSLTVGGRARLQADAGLNHIREHKLAHTYIRTHTRTHTLTH